MGEPWREWSHRGKRQVGSADRYRLVAVTTDASPPAGRVKVAHVPETVVRGSRPPRWVRRGSHAAEAGSVAEVASLAMTRRHIEAMRAKGITVVTLGSGMQNRSGQGFDEVYFEFHPNGRVEVVLVEVKDYSRRRVPLGDFTAVTGDILKDNLDRLRTVVTQKRGRLPVELQTLTPKQLGDLRRHVKQAVNAGLASPSRCAWAPRPHSEDRRRASARTPRCASSSAASAAGRSGRAGSVPTRSTWPPGSPRSAWRRRAPPGCSTPTQQLAAAKVVDKVLEPVAGQPGLFTGASGRVSTFRAVTPAELPDANAVAALAADVVARLQKPVKVPGKPVKPLHVILDLSGLDKRAAKRVNAAVDSALAATGQANALGKRLHRP